KIFAGLCLPSRVRTKISASSDLIPLGFLHAPSRPSQINLIRMPKSSKLSIFSTARATEFLQILVPARNPHAQPPSPVPRALDPAFTQREFCCAIVQHFVAFRCATYPAQAFTASSLFSQRAQDEPGRTR